MLPSLKTIVRAQGRLWDVGVRHKTNGKADRRTTLPLIRVGTCSPNSSILPTGALHPNRLDDHFSCQNDLISNACHWHAFSDFLCHTRGQHTNGYPLQPDAGCQSDRAVAIRSVVRFHLPSLYPRCFRKAFLTATLSSTNCRRSQPAVRTFCPLESVVTKSHSKVPMSPATTTFRFSNLPSG